MLILSLIASTVLWVYANVLAHFVRFAPGLLALGAGAGLFYLASAGAGLIVVALQALLLIALSAYFKYQEKPKRYYPGVSLGLTLLAYVIAIMTMVWPEQRQLAVLRREFPIEDMSRRVPVPTNTVNAFPMKQEVESRLMALQEGGYGNGGMRVHMLRRLHDDATILFVNSPGFGAGRFFRPTHRNLRERDDDQTPIPQPGHRDTSTGDSVVPLVKESSPPNPDLYDLHRQSVTGFIDENRFGYVKSRTEVAGFLPHQFRWMPDPKPHYQLQTLDLIGLVVHQEPVAYVSDNLPRMEELRKAPTRELNEFETAGLEEIKKGDDLFARESDSKLRLFGAIRATKQCTECHGCERGDLLGAFSYVLKRSTP